MLYQIKNGSVSLQGEVILDHFNFEIKGKEKIALVGENGTGKSTLLRLIGGELSLDREDRMKDSGIFIARNITIGYLPQNPWEDLSLTLEKEIEFLCEHMEAFSKEKFDFEQEYNKILTGLGFQKEDKYRKLDTFSGGEQTKLAMIKLLLQKPDLLILDEPTNHLDVVAIDWLEEYIQTYPEAVLYVSHDRYFIDRTATIIYEVSNKKLHKYTGNYTDYRRQREAEIKSQYKLWKKQQEEKERLTQTIEKFKHKPTKASMTRSKKKILGRMQMVEKPDLHAYYIYPEPLIPERMGSKMVYEMKKLSIGYDKPIRQLSMTVRRGQKIGILGLNGSGKSCFLKTISGKILPLEGSIYQGSGLDVAYYSQLGEDLPQNQRLVEYYQQCFPVLTKKEIKSQLSRHHFSSVDYGKMIRDLSGGERAKLMLCILLNRRPNVLLLDEPTNHMDIPSKEVIEAALMAYTGTVLFVTHDRYFLKKLATSLILFEKNDSLYYSFSYEHFLQTRKKKEENIAKGIFTMNEENEALLKSYEAVPTRKRMQSASLSTEQAYADWQLELARKEMEEKQFHLERHQEEQYTAAVWQSGDSYLQWKRKDKNLSDQYTAACLLWYEKYLDYKMEFYNKQEETL